MLSHSTDWTLSCINHYLWKMVGASDSWSTTMYMINTDANCHQYCPKVNRRDVHLPCQRLHTHTSGEQHEGFLRNDQSVGGWGALRGGESRRAQASPTARSRISSRRSDVFGPTSSVLISSCLQYYQEPGSAGRQACPVSQLRIRSEATVYEEAKCSQNVYFVRRIICCS